jgi:hypothetical protein
MIVAIMLEQIILVVEMLGASLAIVMSRALDPVFFKTSEGGEVESAIVADVMARRIASVLCESGIVREGAVTTLAVGHD